MPATASAPLCRKNRRFICIFQLLSYHVPDSVNSADTASPAIFAEIPGYPSAIPPAVDLPAHTHRPSARDSALRATTGVSIAPFCAFCLSNSSSAAARVVALTPPGSKTCSSLTSSLSGVGTTCSAGASLSNMPMSSSGAHSTVIPGSRFAASDSAKFMRSTSAPVLTQSASSHLYPTGGMHP